jgi:hypothetical protein
VKTSTNVETVGNHMPVAVSANTFSLAVSSEVNLLHFDCQGYTHWKEKWRSRLEGHTNFDTSKFASYRKKQLNLFRQYYEQGDEAGLLRLYKQLYLLSDYNKRIFRYLGLTNKIDIKGKFSNIGLNT